MSKPSQSLTERDDRNGSPLFDRNTGEVIGTFKNGKITYFARNIKNTSLASSRPDKQKDVTEILLNIKPYDGV